MDYFNQIYRNDFSNSSSKHKENYNLEGGLDNQCKFEQILMILLPVLLCSFCFDWEDLSNTRYSVSWAIHTPASNFTKNTPLHVVYTTLFSVDISMKHCFRK